MAETLVGLGKLEKRLNAMTSDAAKRQYLGRLGLSAVREAKHLAPRKTSNLSRSITLGQVSASAVTIEAQAPYAGYVEHGTRPHRITPKNAKALRFAPSKAGRRLTGTPRTGASVVFAMSVEHPGTKAQPFMRPGAEKAVERMELAEQVVKKWNDAA